MAKKLILDEERIRQDYEGREKTNAQICADHGISQPTLQRLRIRAGWLPRAPGRGASRPELIERLSRMLERQISHMERNMTPGEEKEIALLGTMARTLEKLMALDRKRPGAGKEGMDSGQQRELAELKRKLAARLEQLRQD